jgi:hypothetical protein
MTPEEWERCAHPEKMLRFLGDRASERKRRLFAVACCRRIWHLIPDGSRQAVDVAERFADGLASVEELEAACHKARGLLTGAREGMSYGVWEAVYDATWRFDLEHDDGLSLGAARAVQELAADEASATAKAAAAGHEAGLAACAAERRAQAHLLRCILGRPVISARTPAPTVGTSNAGAVVKLAALLHRLFGNPVQPDPVRASLAAPAIDSTVLAYHGGAARRLAEVIYDARRSGNLPVLADLLEEAGLTDAALLGHLRGPGPHTLGCHALDAVLGRS